MTRTYFLTGALGCIGAWVTKTLVDRGDRPVIFDLGEDRRRIEDLLDGEALAAVEYRRGDITRYEELRDALAASGAERIVHLAGLQVPFCAADPTKGARVNVLGTLHVFEAAKELGLDGIVYASSAAVYGRPADATPVAEAVASDPATHYGVYKRANEGNARVFFETEGISSVGLRPLTVYGVGRDQGLTSGPTKAIQAAVLGRSFTIPFTGATDLLYAADCAAAFVASADHAPRGAHAFNLCGDSLDMAQWIAAIEERLPEARGQLRAEGDPLPLPPALDGSAVYDAIPALPHSCYREGIADTVRRFEALRKAGRLVDPE